MAVDTSVVVAAFASWHEGHRVARAVLNEEPRLPAHVALETYSVLTRLPPPHRTGVSVIMPFLESRFPGSWLSLSASEFGELLRKAAMNAITGGAVYDALVAMTAMVAGATLATRDRRAVRTYEALGADYRLVD